MTFRNAALTAMALVLQAGAACAQDAAAAKGLQIELNALAPSQKGCVFTFVVGNDLPQGLSKAAFEFVLFNASGTVERMVKLDFRELPQGKTKVRQFDLPGTNCDSIKRVLVNDAVSCEGEGVAAGACMSGLVTRSSTPIGFEG
ncbi:hypothetical protein SAMN05892877_109108 [Rhizobium subbaraonis]|uniref:Tat pathway signal sequence domain protein n=1 Tax=Rhizobium subbaraonis TaxID=908946 RepID=A0A285UMG1_9HYPH|nr:hypothetical protein [Rhizobium subbaraonis]SOC41806.1 hypothetical protein SAMN05892877_109108 [Rhizobium subbaraonis]